MSELARPKSSTKKESHQEHGDNDSIKISKEITQENLEKRLKSLTSFINNIEPSSVVSSTSLTVSNISKKEVEINDQPLKESEISNDSSHYYEMISEQAAVRSQEINFSHLKNVLIETQKENDNNNLNLSPSAPPLTTNPSSQTIQKHSFLNSIRSTLSAPFSNSALTNNRPVEHSSIATASDFNLEKIEQINKLHYPKLNWNKTIKSQTTELSNEFSASISALISCSDKKIDQELMRFFEQDPLCKELEVYYKCKQISTEQFVQLLKDFIELHSNLTEFQFNSSSKNLNHNKHEFYVLVKDYYEARKIVLKCERHINKFKWITIANQMKSIWSFEKYTLESSGTCGDQQRCKHELTSEKAYLNELELTKLKSVLFELRFNLIKNGLISSQFCTKLAKFKLESYLKDFLVKFQSNKLDKDLNEQLKVLIDICFYFYRKQNKHLQQASSSSSSKKAACKANANFYSQIDTEADSNSENNNKEETEPELDLVDDEDDDEDDLKCFDLLFKNDIIEWTKSLCSLLLNQSEHFRLDSLIRNASIFEFSGLHFENIFFVLQHLLRSPDALKLSFLIQLPLLEVPDSINYNKAANNIQLYKQLNLNNFKSDQLINLYFDFYLKLFASFSYDIKYRREFLFFYQKNLKNLSLLKAKLESEYEKKDGENTENTNNGNNWEFINLEGDFESIESVLIDINEDDLIKLYYQIPFNKLFSFLWDYLEFQEHASSQNTKSTIDSSYANNQFASMNTLQAGSQSEFRFNYASMKIISFLDYLSILSIRSLFVYNRLKYKNFAKLIGKTLKETISFLTTLLRKKPQLLHSENNTTFKTHYDCFIKRIFTTVIYSTNLGSLRWTILNQLLACNNKLDLRTKWLLLSLMCGVDVYHEHFFDLYKRELAEKAENLKNYILQALDNELESILVNDSNQTNSQLDIELISFMRTIHFLIDLDSNKEINQYFFDHDSSDFMRTVVKVIFKIAYCYKSTKDICYKEGNSLLFAICSSYPYLINTILSEIDVELLHIGKRSLFLCSELPFTKWLHYIDLRHDLFFLKKCLLLNPTNSILFKLATNIIDQIDFSQSTTELSKLYLSGQQQTNPQLMQQVEFFGLVDKGQIFKLKLTIVLFELHSRLTIYNYFSKQFLNNNLNDANPQIQLFPDLALGAELKNTCSKEQLQAHYSKLAKDKRLDLIYWIWSTLYRMNQFFKMDDQFFINYLESLTCIYSSEPINLTRLNSSSFLQRFYDIYMSVGLLSDISNDSISSSDNSSSVQTVLQPKCPMECFLRLVFTNIGHNFANLFDSKLIDLCQTILTLNKKQSVKLNEITYLILFDWFENLVYKYSTIETHQELSNELRFNKQLAQNLSKHSNLILLIFNPTNSNKLIDNYYCSKMYKRLEFIVKKDLKHQTEYFHNYFKLWLDILMIKNWHKFKNVVRLIDFLIKYLFYYENSNHLVLNNLMHHQNSNQSISLHLINKLIFHVKNDFGLLTNSTNLSETNEHLALKDNNELVNIAGLSSTPASSNSSSQNQNSANSQANNSSLVSGWIQPSLGWISSSLTYVVTTTTTQIGSTVSAAIGMGNSNNEFYDSNTLFTYDKRLYKEFPYVGFYLSLCEERIECELEIWSIFRSYLMGDPLLPDYVDNQTLANNSNLNAFIESCWKKTLNLVNRTKNVGLNIAPQRLMLFKWCERAIDISVEDPILILYWQKFFNLYLDKEYLKNKATHDQSNMNFELKSNSSSSSSNSSIDSITFKLFTSSSQMNSLMKQIKKQLEAASHYYAYQIKPAQSDASNKISAPISTYHFTELMSKLYYALSLWIDEVRLHDPNLYLPALPEHYEPNLLAKIFTKKFGLWLEFLDTNRISFHLNSILNSIDQLEINKQLSNFLKSSSASSLSSSGGATSLSNLRSKSQELFFHQNDRLVLNLPNINELNLKFQYPLDEKYGDVIQKFLDTESILSKKKSINISSSKAEIQLILNVTEHLLQSIFKYNKEFINHSLNYMLKLDDKLTNKFIINLWSNETCEKYVQVPCSSLINPMHQCTRPAMVKFVYEIATKRDPVREEIKENRANFDKLIMNFFDLTISSTSNDNQTSYEVKNKFPHDDIIKSMVALNQLIKKLLKNYYLLTQQNEAEFSKLKELKDLIEILLTKIFYMLIDSYETNMSYSNDLLAQTQSNLAQGSTSIISNSWSSIINSSNANKDSLPIDDQLTLADSIHLFTFDLINLIGTNFRALDQKILLDILLRKLTANISLHEIRRDSNSNSCNPDSNSSSSSSIRRNTNLVLAFIRNKMSLITLCSQFIEPNDLLSFNQYYKSVLNAIKSVLFNNNVQLDANLNINPIDILNQKFSVTVLLLTKFSFLNLERMVANDSTISHEKCELICSEFIDTNLSFLTELNFSFDLINFQTNNNLKLIIEQCINNYVSIVNINYPSSFLMILKRCLEFNGKDYSLKYGSLNLRRFLVLFQKNEILNRSMSNSLLLERDEYEKVFDYVQKFFQFEQAKFRSQKNSFYLHWSVFTSELSRLYSMLLLTYIERFLLKAYLLNSDTQSSFEKIFDEQVWKLVLNMYSVWIEPSSIIEVTSQFFINTKDLADYKNDSSPTTTTTTTPQMAIFIMFDSFLSVFNSIIAHLANSNDVKKKNYALNKFIQFYYEEITCSTSLNSGQSSISDNTLDCYHKCLIKYTHSWYLNGLYEPDYRAIHILSELSSSNTNPRVLKFLAFNLVTYLDFSKLTDSYISNMEIKPAQLNDLLKCILGLLTEFCLRDQIRESANFEKSLKPIYNQAEMLQHWSMLSDESYASVVLDKFCSMADYRYALATRGNERGLLINVLKSSAEFYTIHTLDHQSISCFSSAKRRVFLRSICTLLLKPSLSSQILKQNLDQFQNCIMNLLTDIETFSMSSMTSNSSSQYLKHEIELLIDECLNLLNTSNQNSELIDFYYSVFEAWLSSSKDSPILINFINRLSRNYDLFALKQTEKYFNLLEICLDVYFEKTPSSANESNSNKIELNLLLNNMNNDLGAFSTRSAWKPLMDNIEFKLNLDQDTLFEYSLLKNSSYLLLSCYMSQRLAIYKAIYPDRSSSMFAQTLLKYIEQILNYFLDTNQASNSKPQPGKEEKFVLAFNKLIEFCLLLALNLNSSFENESKIGEQILKLCQLLVFYGEDSLSNQNPLNDSQSLGSDLLSSIGLNILAKKSQFSIKFRFFCKCMSICLLKQILIIKRDSREVKNETSTFDLYPRLNYEEEKEEARESETYFYKLRMQHTDISNISGEILNFSVSNSMNNSANSSSSTMLSTSLPTSSYLASKFQKQQNEQATSLSCDKINNLNSLLKQAAYQFHLIFQTKLYNTSLELIELANHVNQHLQHTSANSQHFCMPQCLNMSKYLSARLFYDKYYLN